MRENGFGKDTVAIGAGVGINEHAKWQPKWIIEKYDGNMRLYDVEEIDGNLLLNEGITELFTLLIGGSATTFSNANAYIGIGDGGPTNLSGTITFTNGSTAVTGSGTSFSSQITVGDFIGLTADGAIAQVQSVSSNTSITLSAPYSKSGGSGVAVRIAAAVSTQTGLQATINKTYAPMDATFPQVSGNTMTFRSTFGPTAGNHEWREFTVANSNSDSGKNLNRKVETAARVKVEPDTWVVQLLVAIS
ncbi:hypothetical protein CLHUN_02060 [Ruminiclostridium hungatei]|uniref:Uncharacterized protein n=1 Tax=Ruminiclostridium hungatei TaxID=48256 RepID=A0A1V4SR85_RUMHU|nr:hypothetical protein [Ruminiclostridium hungatei]OPX46390.1 hypothetical protein CLHUN_02060 [Ruminiclostridium hungatei]